MNFTHLSRDERYQIQSWLELSLSVTDIAQCLGRHRSSIAREIERNRSGNAYRADAAQGQAHERQSCRRNALRLLACDWALVMAYLQLDLSPQQVSKRLALERRLRVSHSGIHQYLRRLGVARAMLRCARRGRQRPRPGTGLLPERVGIEQRPAIGTKVYFADPHSPWQRGLNENHNGLLRYYLPKGSDLSQVGQQQVLEAVYRLNHRPRNA